MERRPQQAERLPHLLAVLLGLFLVFAELAPAPVRAYARCRVPPRPRVVLVGMTLLRRIGQVDETPEGDAFLQRAPDMRRRGVP